MNKNLELTIDQPIAGHFFWTIVWLGHAGDVPRVVDYSRGPMPTRGLATTAGLAALLRHQEDVAGSSPPTLGLCTDAFPESVPRQFR
jgi:hypothetical protein